MDAAEFQRASLAVCELFVLEPLQLIAEYLRVGAVWETPGSAAEVLFDKDPAELTRDDAMTVACRWALYSCQYARGEGCATTSAQSTAFHADEAGRRQTGKVDVGDRRRS